MNLIVGKLAGFCGGVINSINKTNELLDKYDELSGGNIRETGRNLREFSKQYITDYLLGNLNRDGI